MEMDDGPRETNDEALSLNGRHSFRKLLCIHIYSPQNLNGRLCYYYLSSWSETRSFFHPLLHNTTTWVGVHRSVWLSQRGGSASSHSTPWNCVSISGCGLISWNDNDDDDTCPYNMYTHTLSAINPSVGVSKTYHCSVPTYLVSIFIITFWWPHKVSWCAQHSTRQGRKSNIYRNRYRVHEQSTGPEKEPYIDEVGHVWYETKYKNWTAIAAATKREGPCKSS